MPRHVLLMLSQLPQDPSSGAARNVVSICEVLASAGFSVRAVGTTASESRGAFDARRTLDHLGAEVREVEVPGGRVLEYELRGIGHRVLDVGSCEPVAWEPEHGQTFDKLVNDEVTHRPPDILVTFGGEPTERRRRWFVRERGAAVVFALQNLQYMERDSWADVDAVFTTSRFTTDRYAAELGLVSTPLIAPLDEADVVAERRQRRFATFINPNLSKGVMFFARLAEELSLLRPELPILVIEARGNAAMLREAGLLGGFDLAERSNIHIAASVATPRLIYEPTRILLAPSVWEEPFGRVAPEALLNGIPPVVSDRGGLAEAAAGGGFVLPIPSRITPETMEPATAEEVAPWRDLVIRLMEDNVFYADACARAKEAAAAYAPAVLRKAILTFFSRVYRAPGRTAGPLDG